ncbi:MAG: metallophosphoesterase family protein [Chloroflexi bacterium]|nr:metallophosphoesterase family protein [Chloroflexota bacterium]MCI0577684.1 metallophosphoesterase family protein [Chloroflexota bacterium]MCI0644596.1 metallophosphoesterase family protein [Chloroflexota bacterium]MCI0728246.1 metallophosphoesterase family protein [Chloroflexota bacterium]
MRIAVFSDVHGNSAALNAVLADIAGQGGVDGYWVLGDLVALGPDPVGVLERLAGLPNLSCIRGNTDRYVVSGDRPPPTLEETLADPGLTPRYAEVQATFAWTSGAVTAAGWRDWLAALPVEQWTALPDGTRCLAVHAAPGRDDGFSFHPSIPQAAMAETLAGCEASLVLVGHTHYPFEARIGRWQVVNPGSVSNPLPPDLRAKYLILEATAAGYRLERRAVGYDHQAVIERLEAIRHPGRRFIIEHLQGRHVPEWHRDLVAVAGSQP